MLVLGGGKVILADVNDALGQALAGELGASARFVRTDVTDEASAKAAVGAAQSGFGGLHGLVNCAGIAPAERVVGKEGPHALASFVRTININLIGSFNLTRLAGEVMSRNTPNAAGERGIIVYTASVAAFDGQIGQAAYSASKAGLVGMTLPVAVALGKMVPFPPRLGRPEEYASLVGEIIRNEMLNGETIRLDGAIRMAPK
jgi:NAD(P)-dependent dehydrogenase (short-subunit alcohol dehydrogenase family)